MDGPGRTAALAGPEGPFREARVFSPSASSVVLSVCLWVFWDGMVWSGHRLG